jgi:arabinofuranosyltransferase
MRLHRQATPVYDARMIAEDGRTAAAEDPARASRAARTARTERTEVSARPAATAVRAQALRRAHRRVQAGWVALLGALAAWGGWFIFRTSFVVDGRRVFCLFDDAMISMTYARNLVEGYGLNWARQGAPVEGFTHPLWTALMVPVNLLPLALDRRSLVVQLGSLALLLAHLWLVRRLMQRHFTRPGARHWAPACVLTACYFPLDFWALIGMEAALQAVLTTASVLLALDIVHGRRNRHLALLLVGTVALLLRLDMAPLVIAVQAWVIAHGGLRRAGPRAFRQWLLGAGVMAAAVAGYTLFRQVYFHDLLPNTYYLKLGGIPLSVRLLRGGSALLETVWAQWPLLLAVGVGIAPLAVPGIGSRRDREWGRRLALPALVFVVCCAYSVWVGGDAWEGEVSANRFVAFAMPMVFVLFNALANQALSAAKRRLRRLRAGGRRGGGEPLALRYALLAATVGALLAANGLWPHEEAAESWKAVTLVSRPTHADKYAGLLDLLHKLQQIAEPHASVAVVWAGTSAYFSDFRMVDTLGYNDRRIAHGPPARQLDEDSFDDYVPGHVKWDYAYLLDERRPDAILQLWGGKEVVPMLRAHGYRRLGDLWIDPASPWIHLSPDDAAALAAGPAAGDEADTAETGEGAATGAPAGAGGAAEGSGTAGGSGTAKGSGTAEGTGMEGGSSREGTEPLR